MKGTILDFLKLAVREPELARELLELAGRHDFEFADPEALSDEELARVTGALAAGGEKDATMMTFTRMLSSMEREGTIES